MMSNEQQYELMGYYYCCGRNDADTERWVHPSEFAKAFAQSRLAKSSKSVQSFYDEYVQ